MALLPQFTTPNAGHIGAQMAMLGLPFVVMAICSDSLWALVAGKAREWFARDPKRLDKLSSAGGVIMVGLGVVLLAKK